MTSKKNSKLEYGAEMLTGVRPTGTLTVANFLGAIKPIIEFQREGYRPFLFIADLHAFTDAEPKETRKHILGVLADYIALGIDPKKVIIYRQSDIEREVFSLTVHLARLMSVSELLRVPTLKDKIKKGARPESANALLFLYPVMMAADILIQRAHHVPVGEDQCAHIEVTRELARRFNKRYGETLPLPIALAVKSLRILSLRGNGKMSKSAPAGALYLTDDVATAAKKIQGAPTAFEGVMTEELASHTVLAKGLAASEEDRRVIDEIIKEHMAGRAVMGLFKKEFIRITARFLSEFQERRNAVMKDEQGLEQILMKGAKIAKKGAEETLEKIKVSLYS